ncbi:carboxylesterase 1E [Drosophila obscura]|uniref:carboxylesterase 1E n=1 Tax=Drosophila obscura TaxID=7282 RepID=UPI001BB1AFD4|nr:carboxylesterase 1E [Drosophila obscura]
MQSLLKRNFMWRLLLLLLQLLLLAVTLARSERESGAHSRVKRIVGGKQSNAPPVDDPVVFARLFNRDARVEGYRNPTTGIYSFLGMHYAEPPLGALRYARPVYRRLGGDINATRHGSPCIQPHPQSPQRIVGEEDCLLLNVYTPKMPDESTGLPVFVWIHPGGYRYGSAAQYDATPMAQRGAIVVAPQYRLGSLGIMGDGTKQFDGNLAMFDLAAALRWVTDYISYFGGNPKQVQAIGHGSGAASAMYLSMSRTARSAGDVHGVVAMSGTALSQYATDKEPVQSVEEVAKINGCPTGNELEIVNCLRAKSAEDIIRNDDKVQTERLAGRALVKGLTGSVGFQPHIESPDDGRALPSLIVGEPEQQLKSNNFSGIPLLTGVTKHETANSVTVETIEKVFGSAEQFLGSLGDALNKLTGFLKIDQITGQIAKPQLPGLSSVLTPTLQDVWKVPQALNVDQVLSKVVESTTDVLFNLPAVLTTQVWSKLAPAFMYSFDYNGTKSKGINFLRGLPIVSQTANDKPETVGHGDELGYMFDANDIFGEPLLETRLTSAEDLQVRHNLIDMLVQFAKQGSGDGKSGSGSGSGSGSSLFQSVTGKATPFIKIHTRLETSNDFRFCELSVLGASLSPLSSTSCAGLGSLLGQLGGGLGQTIGGAGQKLGLADAGQKLGLGGGGQKLGLGGGGKRPGGLGLGII